MSSFEYRSISTLNEVASDDLNYIALGGADRDVKVGDIRLINGSTADFVVSGVGFQPECLIIFGAVTELDQALDAIFLHYGVATAPGEQWGMCIRTDDNAGGNGRWATWKDDRLVYVGWNAFLDFSCSLQSFDADGFTLNIENAPGADVPVIWVAMRGGGSYKAGVSTVPGATGSQTIDPGFVADCVLFGTTGKTTDAEISDDYCFAMGAADDTRQNVDAISGDLGVVFCTTRQDLGSCLSVTQTDVTGGIMKAQASLVDLDNAGDFELDWTAVDGTAYKFGWLAFQNAKTDRFTPILDEADQVVTTPIAPRGLLTFETSITNGGTLGDPGVPDVNGWVAGASIGVSAVDETLEPEWTASVMDLNSPPFGVIQTKRHLRSDSFGCFRHGDGGLIVGTDGGMVHPLDVFAFADVLKWVPQIYRRVAVG